MNTKLYRSRTDRMVAGVCGGLGQYLGISSTIVRLFFLLLGLSGQGIGLLIYLLLWILLPESPTAEDSAPSGPVEFSDRARAMGEDLRAAVSHPDPRAASLIGGALIFVGVVYLLQNLNVAWLRWLDFDYLWPLLLVAGGLALLLRSLRGEH
jgi:phage shock protein C